MKLKLVYHLYVPEGPLPEIYKYHFTCLKYFANVFDECVFVLSMDNIDDIDTIKAIELKLLNIVNYKNVTFNVIQNDSNMREVQTFKTEVLDKLSGNDDLIFFAHSKGMTNNYNDSLITWICAMYYFSLGDLATMKYRLVGSVVRLFYGPVSYYGCKSVGTPIYKWMYPGTFYWINMRSLYNYSKTHEFPRIESRCYAENFPGNLTPLKDAPLHQQLGISSSDYFYDDAGAEAVYDCYNDFYHILGSCFSLERVEKLQEFKKYIEENLENFI